MTLLVCITGGPKANIQPTILVFDNENRNYPIQNVHDSIPRVSYRLKPRGWRA